MKKNIILQFLILLIVVAISITAISFYNLRTVSFKSSLSNAESISEVIKSGLTAHMVNDNMKDIDTFLNSVANVKNVKNVWLVRSDIINEQFNTKNYKQAKDEIDEEVLKSGKIKYMLNENLTHTEIRVTLPYNASTFKGIDCLKCHSTFNIGLPR